MLALMHVAPNERPEEAQRNKTSFEQHRLRRWSKPVNDASEGDTKQHRQDSGKAEQDVDEVQGFSRAA